MDVRLYQHEAIEAIEQALLTVRATLLVMATGLGKTVVLSGVARHTVARGCHVLVLAHRGELLEQAAATLRRFGLTVAIEQGESRVDPANLPDVTVASVQTLKGARLIRFPADAYGLVVIDEAHHAPAASYRTILDHFAEAKVLGVTATPDRTDKLAMRNVFESVCFRMELGAGIKGGWLSPISLCTVVVTSLDLSQVRMVAGDFHQGELEEQLLQDEVLLQVAVPLARECRDRQTLVFVLTVSQAYALAALLRRHGIAAAAVDGTMSREDRAKVLDDYRAGRTQVVCNAMLWTEGFDAPETSCIALVRPTRSRGLLMQMMGRGTRRAENKTNCLVLDFVPGRAGTFRLAAPADALAGEELPTEIAEKVRALSSEGAADLESLIEQARNEEEAKKREAEAQRRRELAELSIVYEAHRIDVTDLLEAASFEDPPDDPRPASPAQIEALRRQGFEVSSDLNRGQAQVLFTVLDQRRQEGLCSLKQARKLRSFGLRDDLSRELADEAMTTIANHQWRPPLWMYRDPRFSRSRERVA